MLTAQIQCTCPRSTLHQGFNTELTTAMEANSLASSGRYMPSTALPASNPLGCEWVFNCEAVLSKHKQQNHRDHRISHRTSVAELSQVMLGDTYSTINMMS